MQTQVDSIIEKLPHYIEERAYKRDAMRIDTALEGHSHMLEEHQHLSGENKKEIDQVRQFVDQLQRSMQSARNQPVTVSEQRPQVDDGIIKQIFENLGATNLEL